MTRITHHTYVCSMTGRGRYHRALLTASTTLVPVCLPNSVVKWHLLPGNVLMNCKKCAAAIRAARGAA